MHMLNNHEDALEHIASFMVQSKERYLGGSLVWKGIDSAITRKGCTLVVSYALRPSYSLHTR